MTIQTNRLSHWFRSQVCQRQHQLQQTGSRHLNLLNLLGFRNRNLISFDKCGRAVILDTTSFVEDEESSTFNVDLTIDTNHCIEYDPSKDVIVRNYSSSLTFSETEAMVTAQRVGTRSAKHGVMGQSFAGIIEQIPPQKEADSFPFEVGDRVWGLSPSLLGGCWSDYVAVPPHSVHHAPINLPLHYCGLFPQQLFALQSMLRFAKIERLDQLKQKKVLFIGSGRKSMLNILAPFLVHLDADNAITVVEYEQQCRSPQILTDVLGVGAYRGLQSEEEMERWIEGNGQSFDIVIDSFAGDKEEILTHSVLVKPRGLYFWRQNHLSQISQNMTSFRRALKGASYLTDISNEVRKRRDGVRFVPAMDHKKTKGTLDEFTSYLTEMAFPILIDKMYSLDDIQNAFNYALHHDDCILGENVGILLEREMETIEFENRCRPQIVELPPIPESMEMPLDLRSDSNATGNGPNVVVDGDGEAAENITESQTIAKNTSVKS